MKYEIIGIGSALVDITIKVPDSFLEAEGLPKGGMTLVDAPRAEALLSSFPDEQKELSPGGSTANVMAAFAHCGGRAAFIGKVGLGPIGQYFEAEAKNAGFDFLKLVSDRSRTGTGITFITPDGQRTFATYLGAAIEMTPADLSSELLAQAPVIHVEGYLASNQELIRYILDTARDNGQKISLDLSSFGVVQENLDFFKSVAQSHLDIIFANEDEGRAFTGLDPFESLDIFEKTCTLAAVKAGELGSHVAHNGRRFSIPAERVPVADTNGAGDAYAGAVLFGFCKGMDIEACARLGNRSGALMVSQRGARLTPENARILLDFATGSIGSKSTD